MLEWALWVMAIIFSSLAAGYYIRKYKQPDMLIGLYVIFMAMAQILASKVIQAGFITAPASVFTYPFTLILLFAIVEFFGIKTAYKSIGIMLVTQVVMLMLVWQSIVAPEASYWTLQSEWSQIFGMSLRVTLAGLVAVVVAQIAGVKLFEKIRKMTVKKSKKQKFEALRTALTILPILALDSVIFVSLAFFGVFDIVPLIVGQVLIKCMTGVVASPMVRLIRLVGKIKK